MRFTAKLDFLLQLFETNMSKLARGINVDPSLISKWRSGSRRLTADSQHIQLITDYFLKSPLLSVKKDHLILELQRVLSINPPKTIKGLEHALTQYLAVPSKVLPPVVRQATDCSSLFSGTNEYYQVYAGVEGKRLAVLRFLHTVLESPKPLELLFYSQEDLKWMTGDQDFLAKWAGMLREIVVKGHRIKIIHHVNREPDKIISVIQQWLPLHLSGQIDSYFLQKYTTPAIKSTIFVARGAFTIMAAAPGEKEIADHTFFYQDPAMVSLSEKLFQSALSSCQKLFYVFQQTEMANFDTYDLSLQKLPGDSFSISTSPSLLTMPLPLFEKLLQTIAIPEADKKIRISTQISRQKLFISHLRHEKHLEIEIMDLAADQLFPYAAHYYFHGSNSSITNEDYIAHLENLLQIMKSQQNFEHIILDKSYASQIGNSHFHLKKNQGLVITSHKNAAFPALAITFSEPTVLYAFDQYFSSLVEIIPLVLRSKDRNIRLLEERIAKLRIPLAISDVSPSESRESWYN